MNGRKKQGAKKFSVLLDLTKRCCALLTNAKGLVKDNPSVENVFCDINCSLAIKFKATHTNISIVKTNSRSY